MQQEKKKQNTKQTKNQNKTITTKRRKLLFSRNHKKCGEIINSSVKNPRKLLSFEG